MPHEMFTRRELAEFSLHRWFDHLARGGRGHTLESELLAEHARAQGTEFVPQTHEIPWDLLASRTLTAAETGAQLVSEHLGAPQLALSESLIGRLGVPVVTLPPGSHRLPMFPRPEGGQWLEDEHSGVEAIQPTVGSALVQPKVLATLATWSRDWHRDAVNGPQSVEGWLMQVIGRTLDRAMLAGSGTEGEPQGLAVTPGIQTGHINGTATSDDLYAIEEAIEAADGTNRAWLMSPSSKRTLRGRLSGGATAPIWSAGAIDGVPVIASPLVEDGRVFAGDWPSAAVYVWTAPQVSIKAHGADHFASGRLTMRILLHADILFARPERFAVATLT